MTIHKEGYKIIGVLLALLCAINIFFCFLLDNAVFHYLILTASLIVLILILQFFRSPARKRQVNDKAIYAPADGKVVAIEEVEEQEYFKDKRIQLSIFMSPLNVHINWFPVGGEITYARYHPGKYLVAWHPKSSVENERTTIVIRQQDGTEILVRQIAGAVARRIKYYCQEGDMVEQGDELGFIKFGSRVDILLPLSSKISSGLHDKVKGKQTIISEQA